MRTSSCPLKKINIHFHKNGLKELNLNLHKKDKIEEIRNSLNKVQINLNQIKLKKKEVLNNPKNTSIQVKKKILPKKTKPSIKNTGVNFFIEKKMVKKKKNISQQKTSIPSKIFLKTDKKSTILKKAKFSYFNLQKDRSFYCANTTKGLVRDYNEDRISIIVNIKKKKNWQKENWPDISYFAIYDGHGGSDCCEFLKKNLHQYIINEDDFPLNIEKSIVEGCRKAEIDFAQMSLKNSNLFVPDFCDHSNLAGFYQNVRVKSNQKHLCQNIENSGSCALILIIVDDVIYLANVGDSRAFMSKHKGKNVFNLTTDQKPENEEKRIIQNGGFVSKTGIQEQPINKIFLSKIKTKSSKNNAENINPQVKTGSNVIKKKTPNSENNLFLENDILRYLTKNKINIDYLPFRVYPGGLSVSRSFGDIIAKLPILGGNPKVLIASPEITKFKIDKNCDFIYLGCDGIFDRINTNNLGFSLWKFIHSCDTKNDIEEIAKNLIDFSINEAMRLMSYDNLSGIIIFLNNPLAL
jgi:serine/threonine protein phosphatase PrpC